jgi:hypothetical protein
VGITPDAKDWTWVLDRPCPECVAGEQWARPGRRSDGASFTVETFARYFAHDWVHHLHDVGG